MKKNNHTQTSKQRGSLEKVITFSNSSSNKCHFEMQKHHSRTASAVASRENLCIILQGRNPPALKLRRAKAEREGFEPSWRIKRQTVFETVPFSHSGISPKGVKIKLPQHYGSLHKNKIYACLFEAQGFDRIQLRGFVGWIETRN
jgi:hypothetical protein